MLRLEQVVDGASRGEGGVVGYPFGVRLAIGRVQVDVDGEDTVFERDRDVQVMDLGLFVPGEDEPLRGVGGRLHDLFVSRFAGRHLRAAGAGTARTCGTAAHAAAEEPFEILLKVLELVLNALFLFLEGLEADLEGVDFLL
jgi:hypothetical protein